jgi:trehalose synthase
MGMAKRARRAKLQSVPVEQRALDAYRGIAPDEQLDSLQQRSRTLRGARILHVNATAHGGGVAELLRGIVPLMRALGIVADWRVISGEHDFFRVTKAMHNALQGDPEGLSPQDEETYVRTVESNAALLDGEYDFVFVHDPQPLALPMFRSEGVGRWIWRCHIDTSAPNPEVWRYVRKFLPAYHAAVFTLDDFVPADLPVERSAIIPVAIDPLSPKNLDVGDRLARSVIEWLGISSQFPLVAQVARFDPWKDPLGVLEAYRMVRKDIPGLQLALVGAMVADDPEGQKIRDDVMREVADDPLIHIISSGVGNLEVNAVQRTADVVVQKSLREGFGLVVSEALWKGLRSSPDEPAAYRCRSKTVSVAFSSLR